MYSLIGAHATCTSNKISFCPVDCLVQKQNISCNYLIVDNNSFYMNTHVGVY